MYWNIFRRSIPTHSLKYHSNIKSARFYSKLKMVNRWITVRIVIIHYCLILGRHIQVDKTRKLFKQSPHWRSGLSRWSMYKSFKQSCFNCSSLKHASILSITLPIWLKCITHYFNVGQDNISMIMGSCWYRLGLYYIIFHDKYIRFSATCRRLFCTLTLILKHLRQFVQYDWFLPVCISHDKDTASGLRIDPFKHRVLFFILKVTASYLNYFWSKFLLIFESV